MHPASTATLSAMADERHGDAAHHGLTSSISSCRWVPRGSSTCGRSGGGVGEEAVPPHTTIATMTAAAASTIAPTIAPQSTAARGGLRRRALRRAWGCREQAGHPALPAPASRRSGRPRAPSCDPSGRRQRLQDRGRAGAAAIVRAGSASAATARRGLRVDALAVEHAAAHGDLEGRRPIRRVDRGHGGEQRAPAVPPVAGHVGRRAEPCRDRLDRRLLREGALAGQRLQQDESEAVDVGRRGRRVTAHLLRRDVGGRADRRAGRGHARRVDEVRDAEVGQDRAERVVGRQRGPQQDVRRLDVAVDDARLVDDVQGFAEVGRDGCRIQGRDRTARDQGCRACRRRCTPSRGTTGRPRTGGRRTASRATGDSRRREGASPTRGAPRPRPRSCRPRRP